MQGLDPGRYKSTTIAEADERRFSALESQLPDSERYKDTTPFVVRCRACECSVGFAPVANRAVRLSSQLMFLDPHAPF
jgi:DNA polymerase alpha subunit A